MNVLKGAGAKHMNWLRVALLPVEVQAAIRTLYDHGADFHQLVDLIQPRKKPRGRPKLKTRQSASTGTRKRGAPDLSPVSMELLSRIVAEYKELGEATTDKGAIVALLNNVAIDCGLSIRTYVASMPARPGREMTEAKLVASLQQRLSRHRRNVARSLQKSD